MAETTGAQNNQPTVEHLNLKVKSQVKFWVF